jgi:hypothetical protein
MKKFMETYLCGGGAGAFSLIVISLLMFIIFSFIRWG